MTEHTIAVKYKLDPTSIESIKMFCFLKSIELSSDEKIRSAYDLLYQKLKQDYFIGHISTRTYWFESMYEEEITDEYVLKLYKYIENLLRWAK